jgi:UDP-N-acetylglucosamine--N-acetylmuramyl-(pentapeptide) pyrophosphoryl-undecaprenol N-acetylglucosamine transferase
MKICFTGGGTLGHVYPALAIKESLENDYPDLEYYWIGRNNEAEKSIIEDSGIPFYPISSGKLRRYFSLHNVSDVFKIIRGYHQSKKLLKHNRVDVVFSKGGFVSVPVVYAAHRLKIPIVTHESDKTLGLATRLNARVCDKICLGYKMENLDKNKYVYTGNPLRPALQKWVGCDSDEERDKLVSQLVKTDIRFKNFYNNFTESFDEEKPLLLVIGGSLGALEINNIIYNNLDYLTTHFNVYHQMGKTYKEIKRNRYIGVKSIGDEIGFLYSKCALCISRAGAGTINEIINLRVNSLLIPLKTNASRGEQMLNAKYLEENGCVSVLTDRENSQEFIDSICNLIDNKAEIMKRRAMELRMSEPYANQNLCKIITTVIGE